ncbi:DUF2771 domain-containing protein [Streptomyces sp. NPDC060194]|uniref:DUF2771 domain-containing protein n=1 Tax=Streptomyces sp. NPDC060194 TaxID=3347069 RepID=UPI003663E506
MTSARFSTTGRRATATLGAVAAGMLALAACDKPTPVATVTVGSDSVNTQATCYGDGKAIKPGEIRKCLQKKADTEISVGPGEQVRFGVDPEIADNGWTIFLDGQQVEQEPFKKTYRSLNGDAFFSAGQQGQPGAPAAKSVQVSIVEAKGGSLRGVWQFELKKGD